MNTAAVAHLPPGTKIEIATPRDAVTGRRGNWMQTFSGRQFWPLDPRPEEIYIEDIAHSLSMQCRYGGHTQRFYSVAEHSVLISRAVKPKNAFWGLMHDAAEAYASDIIRPIKPYLSNYGDIEAGIMAAIRKRFGLIGREPDEVKTFDSRICLDEQTALMRRPPAPWFDDSIKPLGVNIVGLEPAVARRQFLWRFCDLRGEWL